MEGRELPVGWIVAPIAELATKVGSGATPKGGQSAYLASGIPLIRSMNVVFFGFKKDGLAFISEGQAQQLSNAEVRRGDVLLNITGASIGRVTTAPDWSEGSRVNQHVCIIRPSECLDQTYLSAYLSSPAIQTFILDENYGVTRQALTKQQVLELEIPVPPLNEQRRIAAKLDTTLAAVDACRQRLDGVAAILKRFRQAVLAAATSGELTREWREENADADQWGSTTFGAECHYVTVGFVGKMADQYVAHGVPFLRSLNVRPFRFDRENLAFISPAFHQSIIKSSLLPGDLAVVRTGAPGQCCVIPVELPEANCSDLVIARPGPRLIADFGAIVINSSLGQGFVKSEQVGVAQAHFNVGSMKRAPLNLPSIAEQKEIVRRAQDLLTLADHLEARLTAARKVVDRLTPALLAKAFRGELVPQDPSDEPASVLLERIRAARQAEAGAGTPSRRGRRKAAASPDPVALEAAPVPPDYLAALLKECGALSERALLAASELEPARFRAQLTLERQRGAIQDTPEDSGQVLLEASA